MFGGILLSIAGYLVGSINCAIVLFHWAGRPDPRTRYSGNPGVSNVYRQAGVFWAAGILLADLAKSALLAGLSARLLPISWIPWILLSLLIGNRWPCFHGFKGGKGVANFLGFCLPVVPALFTVAGVIAYGAILKWRRTAFLASFALVLILSLGFIIPIGLDLLGLLGLALTILLIVASHRENIRSLWA